MKLHINDLEAQELTPGPDHDGRGVCITHTPTGKSFTATSAGTLESNRRLAVIEVVKELISERGYKPLPTLIPFDRVSSRPPNTVREGRIIEIVWHHKHSCWNYYIESDGKAVSKRYLVDDLEPLNR